MTSLPWVVVPVGRRVRIRVRLRHPEPHRPVLNRVRSARRVRTGDFADPSRLTHELGKRLRRPTRQWRRGMRVRCETAHSTRRVGATGTLAWVTRVGREVASWRSGNVCAVRNRSTRVAGTGVTPVDFASSMQYFLKSCSKEMKED